MISYRIVVAIVFLFVVNAVTFFPSLVLSQAPITPTVVYVFPSRPPGISLWPQAPFAVNCTSGGVRLAQQSNGETEGVIRSRAGAWEVLSGGDVKAWIPYDPARNDTSLAYYRYGPCWAGGHGHGLDFKTYPATEFETVHKRPLVRNSMEHRDTLYYPANSPPLGVRWLVAEAERLGKGGEPIDATPTPTPTLRPQPTTPLGCCTRQRPCEVTGTGPSGEIEWLEQVETKTKGITRWCWLKASSVVVNPPIDPSPGNDDPTPKPDECPAVEPTPLPKCSEIVDWLVSAKWCER